MVDENRGGPQWSCLLGFLEREYAERYPDPLLQTEVYLSQVSYIATANAIEPLPGPIRDGMVRMPAPTVAVDALVPAVMAGLTRERDLVATNWRGGSVRKLQRILDVILHERERAAACPDGDDNCILRGLTGVASVLTN